MPELMRVHFRQPGNPGSMVDDVVDARRSHASVAADPELWQVGQSMPFSDPEVAVERLGGLAADRQRPRAAALAQHPDDPLIQVHVIHSHAEDVLPFSVLVDKNGSVVGEITGLETTADWERRIEELLK